MAEVRVAKQRAVLDCLATQDNPRQPRCSGCNDQHLCNRIVGVLKEDYNAGLRTLKIYTRGK